MKNKRIWPWLVIGVLVVSLAVNSCMSVTKPTNTPFGVQPPVDVQNNVTGEGTVQSPQSDGVADAAWVAWKAEAEANVNRLSGGLFTGWAKVLSELAAVAALGLATWAKVKGDRDHAASVAATEDNRREIALTDQNVSTVATAAKVPAKELV